MKKIQYYSELFTSLLKVEPAFVPDTRALPRSEISDTAAMHQKDMAGEDNVTAPHHYGDRLTVTASADYR